MAKTRRAPAAAPVPPSKAAPRSRAGLAVIALYLAVAVYVVPVFPHGGSANELTRWATAASIVEHRSFEVSWLVPMVGPLVDAAAVGDRVYSNKAPGAALAAVPAYAAARAIAGPPSPSTMRWTWTAARWLVSTLPLALLAIVRWRRGAAPFELAVLLFATPLFVYSLLLFSHVLAAVAMFAAYRLLFRSASPPPRDEIAAGALAGFAVFSEFPAATILAALVAGVAVRAGAARIASLARVAAGGIPFALALGWYNAAHFGSPLSLSYEHEAFPEWAAVAAQGFHGFSLPTPSHLFLLLASPARGLFFCAPILLLALPRLVAGARAADLRARVRLGAVLLTTLVVAAFAAPHGGWAFGPRYLVIAVPFLVEALIESSPRVTVPAALLLTASIVLCVLPALTFPFPPPEFAWPYATFFRPLLAGGWLAPTLAALTPIGTGWIAWLPVLAAIVATLVLVWRSSSSSAALAGAMAAGAVLALVVCVMPGTDDASLAARRASIDARFFRLDPAARDAMMAGGPLAPMAALIADARGYAPDDWPYAPAAPLVRGPSARQAAIVQLAGAQRLDEAIAEARLAQRELPFASCQFGTYLATLLHQANRLDEAGAALEEVRPLARPGASLDCLNGLFLLGALRSEQGRADDARQAIDGFLTATAAAADPQTQAQRQRAIALRQSLK